LSGSRVDRFKRCPASAGVRDWIHPSLPVDLPQAAGQRLQLGTRPLPATVSAMRVGVRRPSARVSVIGAERFRNGWWPPSLPGELL